MRSKVFIIALFFCFLLPGCITPFMPETEDARELVVVEGLITDQPGENMVKVSISQPLGEKNVSKPLTGCRVFIKDDKGAIIHLPETVPGIYHSEGSFQGLAGRKYTLEVQADRTYRSLPMEMKAVPPIDSVFYEKVTLEEGSIPSYNKEGCQILLNTHDPEGRCRFYRWDYAETWEFRLPFAYPPNTRCWITNNSSVINIKSVSGLAENRIGSFPLKLITNESDRLKVRYSLLVNQYSLNEDEFVYWEKLQTISEETGSLYDVTPSSIPGNIYCVEDPAETVLGYFSVSAKTSKRVFIKDFFRGIVNPYADCVSDTIYGRDPIQGVNVSVWILEQNWLATPAYTVLTNKQGCADCTVRGSLTRPDFWDQGNK